MITEDYCSYEVAKLLKEKGFNEELEKLIRPDGKMFFLDQHSVSRGKHCTIKNNDINRYDDCVSCPTHQMAMKWLREVHNLCIAPYAAAYRYGFTIDKCDTGSNICNDDVINEELITFEKAVDAALKYCLTELI